MKKSERLKLEFFTLEAEALKDGFGLSFHKKMQRMEELSDEIPKAAFKEERACLRKKFLIAGKAASKRNAL